MGNLKYIVALDQGTTSTRAIIFDKEGNIVTGVAREIRQIYPASGWVEHDAHEIYLSCVDVIKKALSAANITAADVAALGITNQRETVVVWDKNTGEPVYNAIVWQCRRTAEYCNALKAEGAESVIREKTGLIIDPYFSATKIKWILDNVAGARGAAERGDLLSGTIDCYVMWKLSEGKIYATDYTNASRTMLFNINTLCWDGGLLRLFDIPQGLLMPQALPSGALYGCVDKSVFGNEIPICGVAGDQQAALFGHKISGTGDVKNTYGTGCFLLMDAGYSRPNDDGLITTLCAVRENKARYALEGSVFCGGAVVQWLRDGLGFIQSAAESEALALTVKNSGGVYLVPAFTGLGAPYWNADCRGTLCGLTRGSTRAHIVRAALESIAYQVNDVLGVMQKAAGVKIKRLAADGGASANNFLMQFQADLSGVEVARPASLESTAQGAAYLAGLTCGLWENRTVQNACKVFYPEIADEKRQRLLDGWKHAVRQTLAR